MCLMVSGLLRGLETFTSQSGWNNPDTIWITLRGLVNWTCNVFMPVYAVLQIVKGCSRTEASDIGSTTEALDPTFCRRGDGAHAFWPAAAR